MEKSLPPVLQRLLLSTRGRACKARVLLEQGSDVGDALAESGVLELFDDESQQLAELVPDVVLSEGERRVVAQASCLELERFCEALLSAGATSLSWQEVFLHVERFYRELAACAPEVVEQLASDPQPRPQAPDESADGLVAGLAASFGLDADDVLAVTVALDEIIGSFGMARVVEALDAWEPDADEKRRLVELAGSGQAVDALVQLVQQAVFAASLDELPPFDV